MHLNWFSPLPPARTEIAQYTARLLPALARCADVTLWTDQDEWDRGVERHARVCSYHPERLPWGELNRADVTVYHLGNNAQFHLKIWRASQQYPGVVVLHDVHLLDFFNFVFQGNRRAYADVFEHYFGAEGRTAAEGWWSGQHSTAYMLEHYPLIRLAVEDALGVFAHTPQAFALLQQEGCQPAAWAPLSYPVSSAAPRDRETLYQQRPLRLLLFGYIHLNRRVESVLLALAGLPERDQFRLDIYGELWDAGHVRRKVAELGLGDRVALHGFVPEIELERALSQAHLAINLRYPTMGEASASQLRIWSHALPTLVTETGVYATLPSDVVAFVRPAQEIPDIQANLRRLLKEPLQFACMGVNGRRLLEAHHAPETYADRIVEFARKVQDRRLARVTLNLADRLGDELANWGLSAGDGFYRQLSHAISELFL